MTLLKSYNLNGSKPFLIYPTHRPTTANGLVTLAADEYEWMKQKNLNEEEVNWIINAKLEDYKYDPIPAGDRSASAELAMKYIPGIVDSIKKSGRLSVAREHDREVQNIENFKDQENQEERDVDMSF